MLRMWNKTNWKRGLLMVIRIKFEKRDEVKYVGHLDTMRTFSRCIKKSDIKVKYSKRI